MKSYGASTLQELEQEYFIKKESIEKWITYNCYEADYKIDNEIYTIQYTHDKKIIGIWDSDGCKIDKI